MAFFLAVHIVITNKALAGRSTVLLSLVQFAVTGIISGVLAFIFEPVPGSIPINTIWLLVFLTVVSTALCIFLQIFGQQHTPPSQASVIMTFEAVFGAVSSILFTGEILTLKLAAGFILMFTAVIISETKLSFFRRVKQQKELIR